jgi:general secretion pathway protein K
MYFNIKRNKATVLITTLWIVAILAIFAISAGRQTAISLRLASYNVDRIKAYFIARAGLMRALAEKRLEYKLNRATSVDALSESWANNQELFENHKFADGNYTVGYRYQTEEADDGKPVILYGLMDEQSKININTAPAETIANLLKAIKIDESLSEEIAVAIIDWRDTDNDVSSYRTSAGAEEAYYQELTPPYHCKNFTFDTIYELILIRGVTESIVNNVKPYITVYGDGKVNINTAGHTVLNALFGPDYPDLAAKIIRYRCGNDDIAGTKDDRWFCWGPYTVERGEEGLVEIKNLQDAEWYANIYGISSEEYKRIKELITGTNTQLSTTSQAYRGISCGEIRRVKVSLEAVYEFKDRENPPEPKFWYQG